MNNQTVDNKKLNDYVGLMRQAEKLETSDNELVYDQALSILNTRKGERICELITDLEKLVSLCMLEVNKTNDLKDANLIMGSLISLESLIEKRDLLKEVLYERIAPTFTPEERLKRSAESIEESFETYYKYKNV